MASPTPAPNTADDDDDSLAMDDKANIIGLLIFVAIILVLFICGGSLVWMALWRWKEGASKDTVDLEQLEGLLDERSSAGRKKSKKKKSNNNRSMSSRNLKKSTSERPGSEWDTQRQGSEWDGGTRGASQDSAAV